jgi:AraC-like DNA-binding protein
MAVPREALPSPTPNPNSILHRLAAAYIPPESAVAIFQADHFPTTAWHLHDFYELAVIESGTAYHVSSQGIDPVQRGTVLFLPPGVGHEYRLCAKMRVYNCLFRAELADAELMWAFRDGHLSTLFEPDGSSRTAVEGPIVTVQLADAAVRRVIEALEPIHHGGPTARTRAGQLGHLLLALDTVATAARASARSGEAPRAIPAAVANARALMERDIAHPWTLTELSQLTYVGPAHLARSFARFLGVPPMHYLLRLRAERAAAMLARTDDSIASIGAAVGWPDPAHFSRRFRAVFEVSPREYRHRHQAGATIVPPKRRPVHA